MMFAKLIDGILAIAPRIVRYRESIVINPDVEKLAELGYKPVTYTEPPQMEPGYQAVESWTETDGKIVQMWTEELEPVTEDKALTRFSNSLTGAEDETLEQATETLIKKTMEA